SVAVSLAQAQVAQRLVLLSPRRQSALKGAADWSRVATGAEECLRLALELAQGLVEAPEPVVVLVDDAELLMDGPADAALRALIRLGRDLPLGDVAAVSVRWLREARGSV